MKAAFKAAKERFDVRDVETPDVKPDECLIKISHCAVCVWCYKEWLRDGNDDMYGPGVTGHEISGVIEKVGPGVRKWKTGDEVLTYFWWHCGTCPECKQGKTTYCRKPISSRHVKGGYAQFVVAAEQCILPSPRGMDLKYAGLITDMVGTAMHAIRRAFSAGIGRDVVAVWGLGPVGLFTVQGLRTFRDVKRIIGIDPVKSRRDFALSLGASDVLDPCQEDAVERLLTENCGRGVDYAFNCALSSSEAAYETLKMDGYLMNITGGCLSVSQCEKRIDGSFYFFKSEYEENLQLVMDGRIKLEPLVTHEFLLDEINEAMELRSKHPDESLKVTIRCS